MTNLISPPELTLHAAFIASRQAGGWTVERQRGFCEALAQCGYVERAAASVGMTRQGAHAFRRSGAGRAFALAWDAALLLARQRLIELCKSVNWKSSRAVVFLDRFGLQIKFSTLEKMAQTKTVDVWYLVPVHAMSRQVKGDGTVLDDGGRSVDEALGYTGWREVVQVVEEAQADMFGHSKTETSKAVDAAWFEACAYERLSSIFDGGVLRETLPLGRNNSHEFSLMFAWANPSGPAKLAAKLAKAVLK